MGERLLLGRGELSLRERTGGALERFDTRFWHVDFASEPGGRLAFFTASERCQLEGAQVSRADRDRVCLFELLFFKFSLASSFLCVLSVCLFVCSLVLVVCVCVLHCSLPLLNGFRLCVHV